MYIALKDQKTTYIGVTIRDVYYGHPEDCRLEENMPVATGIRGSGILIAVDGYEGAGQAVLEVLHRLKGEITFDRIAKEVVPVVRSVSEYFGRVTKDGNFATDVVVATKDALYHVSRDIVSEGDFYASDFKPHALCSYLSTKDLPSVDRILHAYRTISKMRNADLFPVRIYDARTGKSKLYLQ